MQFQVPQFIETEDKVVGPFTLRQFIYIAIGGAFSFMLFFTVQIWLWALLSIFLAVLSLGLGFIKLEGRPMNHVILAAFGFYWQPQTYVWQPEHPEIQKGEEAMRTLAKPGISLENIVSGLALHGVWQKLQIGAKVSNRQFFQKAQERYQIFQKLSGDRIAARRIDYR